MTDTLKPCPFCGGTDVDIDPRYSNPKMDGTAKPIAVYIRHWCRPNKAGQRTTIVVQGSDHADAIEAWNRRTP